VISEFRGDRLVARREVSEELRVPSTRSSCVRELVRTLIEVGAVVVLYSQLARRPVEFQHFSQMPYLTTGHTTTTGVLPVLADATEERFCQYSFEIDRSVGLETYPLPADTWKTPKSVFCQRRRSGILGTYMAAVLPCLGKPGRLRQSAKCSAIEGGEHHTMVAVVECR
jgi:hypothetical protein